MGTTEQKSSETREITYPVTILVQIYSLLQSTTLSLSPYNVLEAIETVYTTSVFQNNISDIRLWHKLMILNCLCNANCLALPFIKQTVFYPQAKTMFCTCGI